jgi:hypothetical protein
MGTWIEIKSSSGGTYSSAALMKTGQTTSYRTGDDPNTLRGRSVDLYVLSNANPFGNTNRFTALDGSQTYTDNIAIDWSTDDGTNVLAYCTVLQTPAAWNTAIDNSLVATVAGYSGWNMWNVREMLNVVDFEKAMGDPFCLPLPTPSSALWTSTNGNIAPSLYALSYAYSNFTHVFANDKTISLGYIIVRYFTRAELGL